MLTNSYSIFKVKHDDDVSTTICQECHDHLEEFHKFRQNVTEKQNILHNEFPHGQFKKESHTDDGNYDQAMFEYPIPIDVVKTEMVDEKDEQEVVIPADVLGNTDLNKEDVLAKVSDGDFCADDINLSDGMYNR